MTIETYDFRSPARRAGEQDRRLDQWLAAAGKAAANRWGQMLSFPARLEAARRDEALPEEWLPCLPETTLGVRVQLWTEGPESLVVLPRTLVLALLDGLMGETVTGLPGDRALTPIEETLVYHLIETLLLHSLRETWPGSRSITLQTGMREPDLRTTRLFPAGETVFVCPFRVTGPFGELDWCWLLPRGDWLNAILPALSRTAANEERERLEKLVHEFPVDLTVRLGTAEVSLAQMTQLMPGDLIMLDQSAREPLTAMIGGTAKFQVRPGAIGQRQAVTIESTYGEPSNGSPRN